jgi:hypothetical protein
MKKQHQEILDIISNQLERYPELRFTQVLFSLDINQFTEDFDPACSCKAYFRDNFNDPDKQVLSRINNRLEKLKKQ